MFNLISNFQNSGSGIVITGGDEVYEFDGYKIHVFNSDGDLVVEGEGNIEYMLVGGGGASNHMGTNDGAGGAGAGGVITTLGTPTPITAGTYPITIGRGGIGDATNANCKGANSTFNSLTALGGGGYPYDFNPVITYINGGCGAGGSDRSPQTGGIGSQGGNGGDGFDSGSDEAGGGGGGYSQDGGDGFRDASFDAIGGDGGDGYDASSFLGTTIGDDGWFAGGGGGGVYNSGLNTPGSGGKGGGGNGWRASIGYSVANDGQPNTGGGSGGKNKEAPVATGGSGIVVIRYPI